MLPKIWVNPNLIPPEIEDVQNLASGDAETLARYQMQRRNPDDELENKIWRIFRLLGYEVIEMGHQRPGKRLPDAIALGRRSRSGLIIDGKIASGGYHLSSDSRALEEYARDWSPRLEREGMASVYLTVVSGSFLGNVPEQLQRIKGNLQGFGLANIILAPAEVLQYLVQLRLEDSLIIDQFFTSKVFHHATILSFDDIKDRYDSELSEQEKLRRLTLTY